MKSSINTFKLLLVAMVLVVASTKGNEHAAAASIFPDPSYSVSGNTVTISWAAGASFTINGTSYDENDHDFVTITLYAQPIVPGLPRFPLASMRGTVEFWYSTSRLTLYYYLPTLNGTYTLPYSGVTYALYLETDSATNAVQTNSSTLSVATLPIKAVGRSYYVTTPGAPPSWISGVDTQNTILGQQRDNLASLVTATNNQNTTLANLVAATQALVNKDAVPPVVSLAWQNGATITTSSSYTLYVYAADNSGGALQMRYNGGSWQPYASSIAIPLSVGYNEIVLDVKDLSGNIVSTKAGIFRK